MSRRAAPGFHLDLRADDAGHRVIATLAGVIDEFADLSLLAEVRAVHLAVHLAGIRRINSFGVRTWIEAVRAIPAATALSFVACAPSFIDQCNMVAGFLGHGAIQSFYAPMMCEPCAVTQLALYEAAPHRGRTTLPRPSCQRCAQEMSFDDLEEQYLLFLRDA